MAGQTDNPEAERSGSVVFTDIAEPESIATQSDLLKAAKRHARWIERILDPGCEETGGRANFGSCNLRGFDFAGLDLRCAGFVHAHLEDAKFTGAKLGACDFSHASLKNADFRGASLSKAKFTGADLTGAMFDDDMLITS